MVWFFSVIESVAQGDTSPRPRATLRQAQGRHFAKAKGDTSPRPRATLRQACGYLFGLVAFCGRLPQSAWRGVILGFRFLAMTLVFISLIHMLPLLLENYYVGNRATKMENTLSAINELKRQMQLSVLGQEQVVESLIITLLANGNVLLEGLPGTAKTRSIKTMAKVLEADLGRIQFTADLLPSDVTGTEIFQELNGKQMLSFQPGPVFNNLVLADEINRAPAKVQGALLEAMEERQVTVAGETHPLPALFMVLATQNPIEQEGTYPLPEAQMDRFLMKINIDYPNEETELGVMRLVRSEEQPEVDGAQQAVRISQDDIFAARQQIHALHVAPAVEQYIVALVMATREPQRYESELNNWIEVGSSPRASIALDKCSRAYAWMQGKDFVDPDDVRSVVHSVLRHRLILSYEAAADGVNTDQVIDEIVKQVAVA